MTTSFLAEVAGIAWAVGACLPYGGTVMADCQSALTVASAGM